MAADSPQRALDDFKRLFRQALDCVTDLYLASGNAAERRSALTFPSSMKNRGLIRLPSLHRQLRQQPFLEFRFAHGYEIVDEPDEWHIRTLYYTYAFQHPDGREIVAYHYDPRPVARVKTPHCHLRGLTNPSPLSRAHFPTGRVSIEEVVRFAITELGVPPRLPDGDWQARSPRPRRCSSRGGAGKPPAPGGAPHHAEINRAGTP